MKNRFLTLAILGVALSALAGIDFIDVPKDEPVALSNGGRLVQVQYFGPAGTCSLSGVRTLSTNAVRIATTYSTNTTYTAVFAETNAISRAIVTNTVSQPIDFLASLPARPGRTLVSYATNTTVTATATTNTVSVLAFCSTNAVAPTLTASAGVPTYASTNLYLPHGVRLIRAGTGAGRATAVLER